MTFNANDTYSTQYAYLKDEEPIACNLKELDEAYNKGIIKHNSVIYILGTNTRIQYCNIKSSFHFEIDHIIYGAHSEEELHKYAKEHRLYQDTIIYANTLPQNGVPYSKLKFYRLSFTPSIRLFIKSRSKCKTTVLSGLNNSGKSILLKLIRKEFGYKSLLLTCNRFTNIDQLGIARLDQNRYHNLYQSFINNLYNSNSNFETLDYPLQDVISAMNDEHRDAFLATCSQMLKEDYSLRKENPHNTLSSHYIEVSGRNLSLSSTGTRLLIMLIAACSDVHFNILLIDEPEIGLSPALQSILAQYLLNEDNRHAYFPHLKRVFIATHSHIFLDKSNLSNNIIVTKTDNNVRLSSVSSISEFHDLQFNMLGNDLMHFFLPAGIVLVEGPTDFAYLKRLLQLSMPDTAISVVNCHGDGGIEKKFHTLREGLFYNAKSPYLSRMFFLIDAVNSVKLKDITKHGVPEENIQVLKSNGIEHYYPESTMCNIFSCGVKEVRRMSLEGGNVTCKGITYTKMKLCELVLEKLCKSSKIPFELNDGLLKRIRSVVTGGQ